MLKHRMPRPDHPFIPALLHRLGAVDLRVVERRPLRGCQASQCYCNVSNQIHRAGGAIVFGWMLVELTHLALIAWHHAVWETPEGRLLDISANPLTGLAEGTTLFALDPQQHYPIEGPLGLPLVFEPMSDAKEVARFCDAESLLHSLRVRYFERQRALPSTVYSPRNDTFCATSASGAAALERLEQEWLPQIAVAEERRNRCLADLDKLQQSLG